MLVNTHQGKYSNFIGGAAGADATNAFNSNFFGPAGIVQQMRIIQISFGCNVATNADNSNFFGQNIVAQQMHMVKF
jgi:hypothetical protein